MDMIQIINSSLVRSDESRLLFNIAQAIANKQYSTNTKKLSGSSDELILVWSMTQGFRLLNLSDTGISFCHPSAIQGEHRSLCSEFLSRFDSQKEANYVSTSPIDFANIIPWLMNLAKDAPPSVMPKINIIFLDTDKALGSMDQNSVNKFWRSLKDLALAESHKVSIEQRRWSSSQMKIILVGECIDASPIEGFYEIQKFDHLSLKEIDEIFLKRKQAYEDSVGGKFIKNDANKSLEDSLLKEMRGLGEQEILSLLNKCIAGQKKGKQVVLTWSSDSIKLIQDYKISKLERLGVKLSPKPDASIGGLSVLKKWLQTRESLFSEKARRYNLPYPKGIMLVGPPGTGKSLVAKTIGQMWHIPVLSLDMGAIYGSLLGQSEQNMRQIISTSEAIAPCILFIDELEKGLSTVSSSGSDGGTSSRIFGHLLTWMSDKTAPVFVVATANNVTDIVNNAPELLRKGRWDEIFWVGLPGAKERQEILKIHAEKHCSEFSEKAIKFLVEATDGNSSADLASIVYTSVSEKFNELMIKGEELPEKIIIDNEVELRNILSRHPKNNKINPDPHLNCILAN